MSNQVKQASKAGRVTTSERRELDSSDTYQTDDGDDSMFKVPPEIQQEADAKGLVLRWINAPKFQQSGNWHKSGWRAFKRDPTAVKSAIEFGFGTNPEGYIIRNDLVLACKEKEAQDRHRARIKQRTLANSGKDAKRGDVLREMARDAGVSMQVHEGYTTEGGFKEVEGNDE
jgi:hypothetical protein